APTLLRSARPAGAPPGGNTAAIMKWDFEACGPERRRATSHHIAFIFFPVCASLFPPENARDSSRTLTRGRKTGVTYGLGVVVAGSLAFSGVLSCSGFKRASTRRVGSRATAKRKAELLSRESGSV